MTAEGSRRAAELVRLKQRVETLQAGLERSEADRQQMLQSKSWRLTAPLRWVRGFVSGGRKSAETAALGIGAPPEEQATGLLVELPDFLRAEPDIEYASTEVFRPLALDDALKGLIPPTLPQLEVASGAAEEWFRGGGSPVARIGFIGSRELCEELAFDAMVRPLPRGHWRTRLTRGALDFVLIETAWEPEGGWRYGLAGHGEEAHELCKLLEEARQRGVPTVLWVREAAANAARYAWIMPHVAAVYAIDDASAEQLAALDARIRIQVLPPAIQPRLHNPVRTQALREALPPFADRVLFDGWWDLAGPTGADPVLQGLAAGRLLVVDSDWEVGSVRIPDLPVYRDAMVGCLSAHEKAALSKLAPVEYVVESELLPQWRREQRALRAAACGAVVVSGAEIGSGCLAGINSIMSAGEDPRTVIETVLSDPLTRMRTAHLGFRRIMTQHCLSARIRTILRDLTLGLDAEDDPRVAAVLVSMRPDRIAGSLATFRAQDYSNRELVLVVHGEADLRAIRRTLRDGERVVGLGRERSLGDCLNFAMTQTDAPYWAKIDDDDHYGPAYFSDLMLYRHTSDAQVWGKPPMFLHSEAHDELGWDPVWAAHANLLHRSAEATSALIAGGTLMGRREVLDTVRFPPRRRGGSDSEFIRQCYAEGFDVLAADGFNFVRFRTDEPGFHTWQTPTHALWERVVKIGRANDVARLAFV